MTSAAKPRRWGPTSSSPHICWDVSRPKIESGATTVRLLDQHVIMGFSFVALLLPLLFLLLHWCFLLILAPSFLSFWAEEIEVPQLVLGTRQLFAHNRPTVKFSLKTHREFVLITRRFIHKFARERIIFLCGKVLCWVRSQVVTRCHPTILCLTKLARQSLSGLPKTEVLGVVLFGPCSCWTSSTRP